MTKLIISAFYLLLVLNTFAQLPNYVPTNGLKVWYAFSGNSMDLSSNMNDAINNGATYVPDRFGNASSAANFDGISSYMILNTPSFELTDTGEFTFSVWVNKQTQTSSGVCMMIGSSAAGNFIANIQGNTAQQFGTNKQQSSWFWAQAPHTLNVWDHYVGTYSGNVMNFYKNGVFQSSNTYTHLGATSAVLPLNIGRGLSANYYAGTLDDIGIWTRALTPVEINDLFTGTLTNVENASPKAQFSIFPVPSSDQIFVLSNSDVKSLPFQIYNLSGQICLSGVLNNQTNQIELNNLNSGMYFIEIQTSEKLRYRIVKN